MVDEEDREALGRTLQNEPALTLEPRSTRGEVWDLEGALVPIRQALAICHHVGFRRKHLVTSVALMTAESQRYERAWHKNLREDGTLHSIDRGAFQINDYWHPDLDTAHAYNVLENSRYAYEMSSGQYFKAWMAFKSGAHERYIEAVQKAFTDGGWRNALDRVEQRWGMDQP